MRRLIKGGTIINEKKSFKGSILIEGEYISQIIPTSLPNYSSLIASLDSEGVDTICAEGTIILPGAIDDQVHFREPGATHKGDIASESSAAALGGVTSYMDMPNNNPPITTIEELENKFEIASQFSTTNYSFYLGATNDNIDQIVKINPKEVCGVKLFMGSSTGNMLVDNLDSLNSIFEQCPTLIATHCEDEKTVQEALKRAKERYNNEIPPTEHPHIRTREACIESTKKAIDLAIRHNTNLHILHVSTADEVEMICKAQQEHPNITFEVCVHYLWFCDEDYERLGTLIKCNPSIKTRHDMDSLREAVASELPSAVATDHAPHLLTEKNRGYLSSPSGLPTVQHSLRMMLQLSKMGVFPMERVPDMMSHSPARRFRIEKRGFLREGYYADIVVVKEDPSIHSEIAYKCSWTPIEEKFLDYKILHTFVNGFHVVNNSTLTGIRGGKRLRFLI